MLLLMPTKFKIGVTLFFIWLIYGNAYTQPDDFRFAHLTVESGLCDNQVKCVLKDSKGFIWMGTQSGLNRFDAYSFKTYKREPFDTTSLTENIIDALYEDKEGRIWAHTQSKGFCIYDAKYEKFIRYHTYTFGTSQINLTEIVAVYFNDKENSWFLTEKDGVVKYNYKNKSYKQFLHIATDSSSIGKSPVTDIKQDKDQYYWLIHRDGTLEKMEPVNNRIVFRTTLNKKLGPLDYFFRIYIDSKDQIWMYSNGTALGIAKFEPKTGTILFFNIQSKDYKLNSDLVSSVVEDSYGHIWIGTDHGGINIIDTEQHKVIYVTHDRENNRSISQNSITCLYKDNQGIIWAGTYKTGLNYYHEKLYKFQHYTNIPSNPASLCFNDINCFCEDKDKNILIGTNGGGLVLFNRKLNRFSPIKYNLPAIKGTGSEIIVSIFKDSNNIIWLGTYYGGLIRYDGKHFKQYIHNPNDLKSISDNRIWEIYEDTRGNLWIGTLGGGLELFDRENEVFYHYRGTNPDLIPTDFIVTIDEDSDKNLWLGTNIGVFVMDLKTRKIKQFTHSEKDIQSLSSNLISYIYRDKKGMMWVGTRDGINVYNSKNNSFFNFRMVNGLPDNSIQAIIEGDDGSIWASTPKGLSKLTVKTDSLNNIVSYSIINYDEKDGLQGRDFNERSVLETSEGEIIFGGPNGFNLFRPKEVGHLDYNPPIFLLVLNSWVNH